MLGSEGAGDWARISGLENRNKTEGGCTHGGERGGVGMGDERCRVGQK